MISLANASLAAFRAKGMDGLLWAELRCWRETVQ